LGKFIEVNEEVADKIRNFLIEEVGESWVVKNKAVVIWWETEKWEELNFA